MSLRGKQRGYTIAELMIVVAIIGLLVGLAFIFFRPGEDALALDRAAQKVAQDVRSVAQLALKAESHSCSFGAGGQTSAYGIFFDKEAKTSYELFADCDPRGVYESGTDVLVKILEIEERNIEISVVDPENGWVIFTPPDPAVIFKNGTPPIIITLSTTTSPIQTRNIVIGAKGVVEVQ